MHWLIKCRSKPATDALREATLPAHRNFLDGYAKQTWYSGPLFTDDNKNAIGSLRLIEFADRAAATAYINADPYTTTKRMAPRCERHYVRRIWRICISTTPTSSPVGRCSTTAANAPSAA